MERDDTISRSEAIDVVKRLMGDYELSRTVQTGLQILPPALPTQCNSSNVLRHPQCANRTTLGNCNPVGGFCTSVPKEICDAQEHDTLNDSDLISRQKAQTELMMKCERYTLARESHGMGHVEWSDELIDLSDAMDAIRDLPSAQPEIIKCRECRYKELKGVDYYCDHITGEEIMVSPNDYCSWAERGTDG